MELRISCVFTYSNDDDCDDDDNDDDVDDDDNEAIKVALYLTYSLAKSV